FDDQPGAELTPLAKTNGNGNGNGNGRGKRTSTEVTVPNTRADGSAPIGSVRWRQSVRVSGRVTAMRVEPLAGSPSVEYTLTDNTGSISVVFFGRRQVAGMGIGTAMVVDGMTIDHHGRL